MAPKPGFRGRLYKTIVRDKYLLLLMFPIVSYYVLFHYVPMYGLVLAFSDFSISRGILGSEWVGFRWFEQFFGSIYFGRVLKNTLLLSVYSLVWGFPIPIVFALMLHEIRHRAFKRVVQTVSYMPHFISVVIVVGMIHLFLSPNQGIVNAMLERFGWERINFMMDADWFRTIYVGSGVWQSFGWSSIIYLAALSSIDPQLYDAASIDGAGRWKKMIHINVPGIAPTIIILLILNVGNMMSVGFEKVFLMQHPVTYGVSDVIETFVYRSGVLEGRFGYSTAVGLFNSVVNFTLLVAVNYISRRLSDNSLW